MTNRTGRQTGDNGVSESIGFLLIFGMVITGIGLVTLYGYPMLLQQQTSADKQIMQKNMIVLQNDMKSLAYKTVPYKETSLNIGSGTLTAYDFTTNGPTFRISDGSTEFLPAIPTGDLRYYSTSTGVDISLQNGAVVTRDLVTPGSAMLAHPRWFYDPPTQTMVINLIYTETSETISRAGIGTVQMELGDTYFYSYSGTQISNPVYVEYTPDPADSTQDYSIAWDNYFKNTMEMSLDSGTPGTDSMISYRLPPTTTLVIKRTIVKIRSL